MPTRRAHAKLNLCLFVGPALAPGTRVDGRDASGFHEIASWMHAIDLFDELRVERLASGPSRLEIAWAPDAPRPSPIDWPVERDLAWRAHGVLERHAGRELPVAMRLDKRIPVGAGLGGGSSDAAAALVAIDELFGLGVGVDGLRVISRELGSDVAFFVDDHTPPRPALVCGLGGTIERVERREAGIVLVTPGFACATPAVYRAFDEHLAEVVERRRAELGPTYQPASPRPELVSRRIAKAGRERGVRDGLLENDLYPAAARVEPRLHALATALSRACHRRAHLTGSGSCLFLVCEQREREKVLARARDAIGATGSPDPAAIALACSLA